MHIKKFVYLSLLVTALLFTNSGAYAADLRIVDKNNGNVHVEQNEEVKNLYTAGNIVLIDANVQKGLYSAGNVVTINGDVGGTVFSGAGTLSINGDVGGSVHGGGSSVIVNSNISDDVFVVGGNLVISKSASIGDDLYVGGGVVDISGNVSGNAYIDGGVVTINSEISGDVKINQADKIRIGSNAKINGNLEYSSENEIEIEEGAIILGETTIIKKGLGGEGVNKGTMLSIIFAIVSLSILVKIVSLIIFGLILIYLFRKITENTVKESLTNFWKSLGIGLVFLIIIPIITIILLVTVVGAWLGIIVGILYVLSIILAISFSGITFGSWLFKIVKKNKDYSVDWKIVVAGIILLTIIRLIPIVGGIVALIFMLISLGAIYRLVYKVKRS